MTTVVSLREINEATLRALKTHGASHGEASTAARMVLEAEILDGSGLTAVLDDLPRAPWQAAPVEMTTPGAAPGARAVVLGSSTTNRILREGPLVVDLAAGDPHLDVVAAPGEVTAKALLDPLLLEIARVGNHEIAVVLCTREPATGGASSPGHPAGPAMAAHVRWARPDGSMGVATIDAVPALCRQLLAEPGVLALRDVDLLGGLVPTWILPAERSGLRERAAGRGVTVDAATWWAVRTAARRYLVPD